MPKLARSLDLLEELVSAMLRAPDGSSLHRALRLVRRYGLDRPSPRWVPCQLGRGPRRRRADLSRLGASSRRACGQ